MAALLLLLASLAIGAERLPAQAVQGRLIQASDGEPIAGALVQLRSVSGHEILEEVISGSDGAFHLKADSAGRVRVHVERIGYREWNSDTLEIGEGETVTRRFRVDVRPVDLGTLEVEADTRCRVRPEGGRRAARLWEEIRTALRLTRMGQRDGLLRFRVRAWERELDPDGERIQKQRTWTRSTSALRPFTAASAETLADDGFVQGEEPGSRRYYAPTARTLVSDPFLETHCLEVVTGEEGRPGLRFRPVPGRDLPDVRGTLWVDGETAELQRLEYRYVNVRSAGAGDRIGGRTSFRRLPSGEWIVDSWRIRMPEIARERVRLFDRTEMRLRLEGLKETGRRVVEIRSSEGELLFDLTRATVAGTVVDSTRRVPLEGAVVRVVGTERADTTDAGGRYRLSGLPEGSYRVYPDHARYRALGLAPDTSTVALHRGRVAERDFGIPSAEDTVAADLEMGQPSSATVFGAVVRRGTSDPIGGVRVTVDGERFVQVTDSTGTFRFPDLGAGRHRVSVHHVGYRDWTDTFTVAAGDTAALRLQMSRQVVDLEPVEVNVERPEQARFFGEAARTYSLAGRELADVRRRSPSVAGVIRALDVPGLSVRENQIRRRLPSGRYMRERVLCVERSRHAARRDCAMVDVYVDGAQVANPRERLRTMDESVIRRVEFVPAAQAGARFGTGSGQGVLLIETRDGDRPGG